MRQSEERFREIVENMHDLGNADLALRKLPSSSTARHNLQEIGSASRRAAELCRQMLVYSGKGKFVVQPLNLSTIV
jgi:hypothetical protein